MQSTWRSLPSQLQMVPVPVHVRPLLTSHRCCPVAGALAQMGTGWYRHAKEASGSSTVAALQAALLLDTRDHRALPKSTRKFQTGGHSWLCLCSPGDPFFFPNTLPPQTGDWLPLGAEHFRAWKKKTLLPKTAIGISFPHYANIPLRL